MGPPVSRGSVVIQRVRGRLRDPRTLKLPIPIHTLLPGAPSVVHDFDPDVVYLTHDRWFLPNFELALASAGRRLVISPFFHPYRTNPSNFPQTLINRVTMRRADAVHAVTAFEAKHLNRVYGVDAGKVSTFPQGVRRYANPRPAPRAGRDIVLFVGRLDAVKGPQSAALAFCQARSRLPDGCKLVMVGRNWGELGPVTRIMSRAGARDRFEHKERVESDELSALYDRAIVCVLPSEVGAFGYPIFESLARGTPIVTVSLPQTQELVTEGGVLVDRGDTEAMAGAIRRLASDDETWDRTSSAGFDLARSRFSAERMVANLRRLFEAS